MPTPNSIDNKLMTHAHINRRAAGHPSHGPRRALSLYQAKLKESHSYTAASMLKPAAHMIWAPLHRLYVHSFSPRNHTPNVPQRPPPEMHEGLTSASASSAHHSGWRACRSPP